MDVYTHEIYNFLKTVTIKSSFFADQYKAQYMNNYNLSFLLDEENPYYTHLAGLYSKFDIASSDYIYVQSVDTLHLGERIILDRNTINSYPRTVASYKLPGSKYDELCNKYPKKKHLIQSILYPIKDLSTGILAKNFEILCYDDSLLQSNEKDSMIQCMNDVVSMIKTGWYIEEFLYSDMYPIVLWDSMWKLLYLYLYLQRVKNIKTPSVHVSHIWYYLTSKGLPDYRAVLDFKQQYWLYKNMDYLTRNKGKNSNIRLLAENILSPYAVELKQKSVLLNYQDGLEVASPIVEVISEDMYVKTTPTANLGSVFETLPTLLKLEATNNLRRNNTDDVFDKVNSTLTRNRSTYHPTRIIEIDKKPIWADYNSLYAEFIVDNYFYRYSIGDLTYKILMESSSSGISKSLSVGEGLAFLNYCLFMQASRSSKEVVNAIHDTITITDQPTIDRLTPGYVSGSPSVPINIPTKARISTVFKVGCNPNNESMLFNGVKYTNIENRLPELITIPDAVYNSPEEFMEFLNSRFRILYRTSLLQRDSADASFYHAIENIYKNHMLKGILPLSLVEGFTTYAAWFDSSPDLEALVTHLNTVSDLELEMFIVSLADGLYPTDERYSIVRSSTILNEKYNKLKQLFIYLCSYSLGFVDTQNDDQLNFITFPNVLDVSSNITHDILIPLTDNVSITETVHVDVDFSEKEDGSTELDIGIIELDIPVEYQPPSTFSTATEMDIYFVKSDRELTISSIQSVNYDFLNMSTIDTII